MLNPEVSFQNPTCLACQRHSSPFISFHSSLLTPFLLFNSKRIGIILLTAPSQSLPTPNASILLSWGHRACLSSLYSFPCSLTHASATYVPWGLSVLHLQPRTFLWTADSYCQLPICHHLTNSITSFTCAKWNSWPSSLTFFSPSLPLLSKWKSCFSSCSDQRSWHNLWLFSFFFTLHLSTNPMALLKNICKIQLLLVPPTGQNHHLSSLNHFKNILTLSSFLPYTLFSMQQPDWVSVNISRRMSSLCSKCSNSLPSLSVWPAKTNITDCVAYKPQKHIPQSSESWELNIRHWHSLRRILFWVTSFLL